MRVVAASIRVSRPMSGSSEPTGRMPPESWLLPADSIEHRPRIAAPSTLVGPPACRTGGAPATPVKPQRGPDRDTACCWVFLHWSYLYQKERWHPFRCKSRTASSSGKCALDCTCAEVTPSCSRYLLPVSPPSHWPTRAACSPSDARQSCSSRIAPSRAKSFLGRPPLQLSFGGERGARGRP